MIVSNPIISHLAYLPVYTRSVITLGSRMASSISESLSSLNLNSDTRRPKIRHNKNNNTLLEETRGDVANARNESNVIARKKSLLNISIGEAVIGKYVFVNICCCCCCCYCTLSHLASPTPHESKRARQVVPANSTMDMTHIQDHYMECIPSEHGE